MKQNWGVIATFIFVPLLVTTVLGLISRGLSIGALVLAAIASIFILLLGQIANRGEFGMIMTAALPFLGSCGGYWVAELIKDHWLGR